jgi:hypothetical protein
VVGPPLDDDAQFIPIIYNGFNHYSGVGHLARKPVYADAGNIPLVPTSLATSDCEYFVPLLKHFWPDNNWCQARVALVLRTNPTLLRTYDSVATVALAVLMAYYTLTLEQQAALKDQCPGGTFTENIPHELHLDAIWHLLHPRVLIIRSTTDNYRTHHLRPSSYSSQNHKSRSYHSR